MSTTKKKKNKSSAQKTLTHYLLRTRETYGMA